MELAALATRAVPGLSPTGVADAPDDARDFMAAVVVDASGNRWRVRGPQHSQAAMRLETEVQVLRGFSTAIRAELPFRVPSVAGATRVEDMRIFVYNHLPGATTELAQLTGSGPELTEDLGRTAAAIHDLSETVVDHADLPRHTAERLRQRRLNELDSAAATGQVPPLLLRRWEHAMEDKDLWNFTPTVVHGDLHEDNLLVEGERVVAVTGWTDLHIGDPADDLAWLIASPEQKFSDAVVAAYRAHRSSAADEHILRRAALSAEFALAQWLVRGQAGDNQQMTDEALGLLKQLASDIETYGGRPIALSFGEAEEPPTPADVQDSKPVMRPGAAATIADTGEVENLRTVDADPTPAQDFDTDDEPAVITDADADTEDDPSGRITPLQPRTAPAQEPAPAPDQQTDQHDPATEEIPAYVEDHFSEDSDYFTPVSEPHPTTGSLPIQPDSTSENRAKQKNFFPASAGSAASGRSAQSAQSASSSAAASADSASNAESHSHSPSASAEEPPLESPASAEEDPSTTRDAVYSRHPGLRPPH